MTRYLLPVAIAITILVPACRNPGPRPESTVPGASATFGEDLAFLRQHLKVHVLQSASSDAQIAIVPEWQGRVMTSSARGPAGLSYGWMNYGLIRQGIQPESRRSGLEKHIYVFGGEERIWFGPEGGQYALFFAPDAKAYTFENWKTPAVMDTEPFAVKASSSSRILFDKSATLVNHAGAKFHLRLEREVRVLEKEAVARSLKVSIPEPVRLVGYQSRNVVFNTGTQPWTEEGGLISVWMLGMLKHGPGVTIVIPLATGNEPAVNADYFGSLENDRLRVSHDTVFFKGDGQYRSKIGIPPDRAKGVFGSYDAVRGVLTVLWYNQPENAGRQPYVRSQWKDNEHPYAGDVINAYNDGAPEPGAKPLGPFYELESSSPSLPLLPGQSITHIQSTVHFEGTTEQLDPISRAAFGVSIEQIIAAFR